MSGTKTFSLEFFKETGARGGAAGRGAKKKRGTKRYYKLLSKMGVEARKKKAALRLTSTP